MRNGRRTVRTSEIASDGRLVRPERQVQRWACTGCGRLFEVRPESADVLNAVVDVAKRSGISAAAARFACDHGTVQRMLRRWMDARQGDLATDLPDVLLATPVQAERGVRVILCDAHHEALVDVLADVADLPGRVADMTGSPSLVGVDVDPKLALTVRSTFPAAVIAVPPRAAVRPIEAAALATFRALRRAGAEGGRNYREDVRLLTKADADLSDDEREDLRFWARPLRRLRFALLALLEDLRDAGAERFADTVDRVCRMLRTEAPACPLEVLLTTWRAEFVAGVADRWLDRVHEEVDRLRSEIRRTRPRDGFDVMRAILVFSVEPEPAVVLAAAPEIASVGIRPIAGVLDALSRVSV